MIHFFRNWLFSWSICSINIWKTGKHLKIYEKKLLALDIDLTRTIACNARFTSIQYRSRILTYDTRMIRVTYEYAYYRIRVSRIIEYACHTNKRIIRTRVSIKYAYHTRTYHMHIRKRSSYDEIIFHVR